MKLKESPAFLQVGRATPSQEPLVTTLASGIHRLIPGALSFQLICLFPRAFARSSNNDGALLFDHVARSALVAKQPTNHRKGFPDMQQKDRVFFFYLI